MKIFFTLLLLIFIIGGLLILGNMLRCMSARGEACPGWCLAKPVKCISSDCEKKISCQAPSYGDYLNLISRWLEETSQGKIKL